jgi:hypothetical protein
MIHSAAASAGVSLAQYLLQIRNIDLGVILYGTIFISVPGILTNVLNIVVFNRSSFKGSIPFFYTILSIADIIAQLNAIFLNFPLLYDHQLNNSSIVICRLSASSLRVVAHVSSWTQVIITVDRMLNILYNAKYKQISGHKYHLICLVGMISILLAFNWITFDYVIINESRTLVNNQTIIQFRCNNQRHHGQYLQISGLLLRALVPFVIMFLCNLVLINALYAQKKKINKLSKKEFNFAFTIIATNYLFLLLNMPLTIYQLFIQWPNVNTEDHRARIGLLQRVGYYTHLSYSAYTILIYLRFNKLFRKEFFSIFKCSSTNQVKTQTSQKSN